MSSPRSIKAARLLLGAILLAAFALRLWGLDQHNIWWDEGFTVWMARLPLAAMIERTAHDTHPPLSYLAQHAWWLLTGDGEWQMRFLSVFGGTAGVAVVYAFARRLGGQRAGLLAATFLAISVFAISWSQEIRMYAWVSFWGLLTIYASLRMWHTPRVRWFILYVGATAAGLFSLYLSALVPLVANLAFLVFWWRAGRSLRTFGRWALAQIAVLALLVPWLAYTLPRMPRWSAGEPYSPAFFARLYATVLATGIGENIEAWLAPAAVVLLVAAVSVIVLVTCRKSPLQAGGSALLIFAVLLPPALVYLLTAFPGRQPYVPPLSPRYFLPLAASFSALLGWGLAELSHRTRFPALAGAGIVSAVAVASVLAVLPGRVATDQYASLAATLAAHLHPGDKVLLYPDEDWPLFAAQYAGAWEKAPGGMEFTPEGVAGLLSPMWESSEGLWVVTTPKAQEDDHEGLLHTWLEQRAKGRTDWDFGETRLTLYARTVSRVATLHDLGPSDSPDFASILDVEGAQLAAAPLPLRRYLIGDTLYATIYWETPSSRLLSLGLREVAAPQELLPPPPPVTRGAQRVVGRLALTPELHPGMYNVVLRDQGREVASLGMIELVSGRSRQPGAVKPQYPLDVRFGEHIRLVGYDLPEQTVAPGDFATLTLYWQTDSVLTDRYKVFTHLIGTVWNADLGTFLWGQQDNEPQGDQLPTTRWPPSEVIVDRYRIKVNPKAPAGNYQVEAGIYGLMDGARLSTRDGKDAVTLGQVQVK